MPVEVGDVVVVDEMGAEIAAAEPEFGRRLVEDPLAAAPEDARVVGPEIGGVEDPGALFVDLVEADPLVDVGGCAHCGRTYWPSSARRDWRVSGSGEVVVHRTDRARTLADGGRDPLHRTVAHVADGEHAGLRGLEREQFDAGAHERGDVTIGHDEAVIVEFDDPVSQSVNGAAPMKENMPEARRRRRVGASVRRRSGRSRLDGDLGERLFAVQLDHLRAWTHGDVRRRRRSGRSGSSTSTPSGRRRG